MSKLHITPTIDGNYDDCIANGAPSKIWVCHCEQCRYVKNKRKNRKAKVKIKRLLNKKRRKEIGSGITYYWA